MLQVRPAVEQGNLSENFGDYLKCHGGVFFIEITSCLGVFRALSNIDGEVFWGK